MPVVTNKVMSSEPVRPSCTSFSVGNTPVSRLLLAGIRARSRGWPDTWAAMPPALHSMPGTGTSRGTVFTSRRSRTCAVASRWVQVIPPEPIKPRVSASCRAIRSTPIPAAAPTRMCWR